MCGIVGYIGCKNATPVLINGLKKLEYRGYDSAGIAVLSKSKEEIIVKKSKGALRRDSRPGLSGEKRRREGR